MLYKHIHCHPKECHRERHPLICLRSWCSQKCASRSRPAGYRDDISYEGIAITNGLDVDEVKLLSVNKCHSIFIVWTYDPNVGAIDDPDNTWKVRNIIKFLFTLARFPGIGIAVFASQ